MFRERIEKMLGQGYIGICKTGFAYLREGRYTEALELFDQAIAANPRYTDAYMGKGKCRIKQGEHEAALQCFEQVLEMDAHNLDAAFERGLCQIRMGRIREATQSFDAVLAINPDYDLAWDNKAVCYQLLGERVKAVQCVRTGMVMRGEFQTYQPLMGKWYSSR
ncbi:MAG: tetratricopeptide repeat protein [Methanomicrobiales archaeon]|nr:tetratricopeptide repeat protein [Methanomicrobiales archaeon]